MLPASEGQHALVDPTPFDTHGTIDWLGLPQCLPTVLWFGPGAAFALLVTLTVLARRHESAAKHSA
jgi:hypothetical protein